MRKSDINNRMLFKIRDGRLCVLIPKGDNRSFYGFYGKDCITTNNTGGISDFNFYNDDLTICSPFDKYDIISIKQCITISEVLYYVLNDIEPKEWDWVREEKMVTNEVKKVKLSMCIKNKIAIEQSNRMCEYD